MIPFYFGAPQRRLFGVCAARTAAVAMGAVLLLNPFGQEAIRVHRLFRTVATRLSRMGYDVLRFDYFGTGDSAGDDSEGDLAGWCDDLRVADAELRRRSRTSSVTWAGGGLGASLAVLTAPRVPAAEAPSKLVLWTPVIDGRAYREELRRKHVEALEATYSFADPAWRLALERDERAFADEAMGFGISPALDSDLRDLDLTSHACATIPCHVLAHEADVAITRWRESQAGHCRFSHLNETFDLAAEELRGAPLVPPLTLRALLDAITADHHG